MWRQAAVRLFTKSFFTANYAKKAQSRQSQKSGIQFFTLQDLKTAIICSFISGSFNDISIVQ
jgi:hypothetical protein